VHVHQSQSKAKKDAESQNPVNLRQLRDYLNASLDPFLQEVRP
jgi:hypothetical protein